MKDWAAQIYKRPSLRFLVVGGSNLLVTYATYLAALLVFDYGLAFLISFIAGLVFTSVLTIRHAFNTQLTTLRVAVYGTYYILYFAVNLRLIELLVEDYDIDAKWAPLLTLTVLTPVHFLLSKALVAGFRRFGGSQSD